MTVERLKKHGVWEAVVKADAPPGRALAVRGVISTAHRDLQDEVVDQDGLDLSELGAFGWINDNHSKKPGDEYGQVTRTFPLYVTDGSGAKVRATGIEGFLFDTPENRKLHANAVALRKAGSPRGYGFSIEGQVLVRDPHDRRTIRKARITQVALTRTPVNTNTALEAIAKSLDAFDTTDSTDGAEHTGTTTGTIAPTVPQDLAGRSKHMKMKGYLAKRAKEGCSEARGHLEEMAKGGDAEAQSLLDDMGEVSKGLPDQLTEVLRKSLDDLYTQMPAEGAEPESLLKALPDEVAKALPALPPALQALSAQVEGLGEELAKSQAQMVPAVLAIGEALLYLSSRAKAGEGDGVASGDIAKALAGLTAKADANDAILKSLQAHLKAPAAPAGGLNREQMDALGRAQGLSPVKKSIGGPAAPTTDDLKKSLTERRDAAVSGSHDWHAFSSALKSLAIGDPRPAQELLSRAG